MQPKVKAKQVKLKLKRTEGTTITYQHSRRGDVQLCDEINFSEIGNVYDMIDNLTDIL